MTHVALIGAGRQSALPGRSCSPAQGLTSAVYDAEPASAARAKEFVRSAIADLAALGLASPKAAETIAARVKPAARMEDALDGGYYVQESAPERVEIKSELYATLDASLEPETILASSTSGLPASAFTEGLEHRARCLVVHPINPPHLIPLVEIVPAPWTDAEVVDRSHRVDAAGRPVADPAAPRGQRLRRQPASERAARRGVPTRRGRDRRASTRLIARFRMASGLRWSFMGPFQTIDLNAKTGVAEYCRNLGPMYYGLAKEQADPRPWTRGAGANNRTSVARTDGSGRHCLPPAVARQVPREAQGIQVSARLTARRRVRWSMSEAVSK